ncbi:TolC family protein [Mucilaginibacter lacusdianchii]|uniref:TolC family protein n=1 Tax=Mucilaginibacter lacusdianchii TaxID=2684211 RepID=UPI001E37E7AB|nr:TolC family protein [Mucilaginibacter sp. JXJ CY 39]
MSLIAAWQAGRAQVSAVAAPPVPLTLQQVWNQAEQYNKSIQMQQLSVRGSEEEIKDAKAERLPEITAAGEYAYVSNLPMYENGLFHTPTQYPVLHTYYRFGGDATFNLYAGNKTNLKIKEQETIKHLREEQKRLTVSEIKLRAAQYFLELRRGMIFKGLMQANIAEQEKQLDRIRVLQKNGVVLKSDALRAELQLSRQRLTLEQIENDIAIANQKLNIVIGQPNDAPINPLTSQDSTGLVVKSYSDYLTEAFQKSYQNKISEQETELRRLQVKDIKANVSPRLGLFANYAYSYPQIQFYPYGATLYGLGMTGVRASFPISSFYHNKHKVKASELEYQRQELEHQDTQDMIRQQVNEAYLRYKEALDRITVAQNNIRQATENARIVNNTYFNQLSLVTDLLQSNTEVLQTQFDLASAQIAAQLQYYQLQKVIGNL